MLENFQGDSWGLIPPLRMPSLLPHDLCHGQSSLPAMDCSSPGSSCPWDSQARILKWVAPCPPPGDLPNPWIKPMSPALQADSLPTELWGKPYIKHNASKIDHQLAHFSVSTSSIQIQLKPSAPGVTTYLSAFTCRLSIIYVFPFI